MGNVIGTQTQSIPDYLQSDPLGVMLRQMLGAALPPASTISVLAAEEGGDEILTGNGLVITTAMSVISIPLFTMLVNMLW